METDLTKQDILELFVRQSKVFEERLEKSQTDFDLKLEKSQSAFDKRLGELAGTWGKFVAEKVKPKIVELFKAKNIQILTSLKMMQIDLPIIKDCSYCAKKEI